MNGAGKVKHVTGNRAMNKFLNNLGKRAPRNAARSALTKSASLITRTIRSQIPAKYPMMRQAIGWRPDRQKGPGSRGKYRVKVGASVTMGRSKQRKALKESIEKRKQEKKPGVGISSYNIHWVLLGTAQRTITRGSQKGWPFKGMSTGKMPVMFPNLIKNGIAGADTKLVKNLRVALASEFRRTRR